MKQFRVEEIITTPEGRVILNGPSGSLDVQRYDRHSCAQRWHTLYDATDDGNTSHRVAVSEIPEKSMASIAF